MKCLGAITSSLLFIGIAFPTYADSPDSFIVVGVAGFRTKKPHEFKRDIFSDAYATSQHSGAWENLPTASLSTKILKDVYLTHFASLEELRATIDLFLDNSGQNCRANVGLIVMANSWGVEKANRLSDMYFQKCHRQTDLFVIVDGIVKPVMASFDKRPNSRLCFNYYQLDSVVHGIAIAGCVNEKVELPPEHGMFAAHVGTEWWGTLDGYRTIWYFLSGQLPDAKR